MSRIRFVADYAAQEGLLSPAERNRICGLLERLGFTLASPVAVDALLVEMGKDKKSSGERLHLVVPRGIGRCEVQFIDKEQLKAFR